MGRVEIDGYYHPAVTRTPRLEVQFLPRPTNRISLTLSQEAHHRDSYNSESAKTDWCCHVAHNHTPTCSIHGLATKYLCV